MSEAQDYLLESYNIQQDTTRIYGCGCNFQGRKYDQDEWREYFYTRGHFIAEVFIPITGNNSAGVAFITPLEKAEALLKRSGWCKQHAKEFVTAPSKWCLVEDTAVYGVFITVFDSKEQALSTFNSRMKELEELV